ncbi:hypothetical protein CTAYLR_001703 [Chrysophaeum taylorii]|uniref:Alpha-L-glutamate ligase-related protein ATP-grasp domain-containing protein n=1 Tax=Chrysophaeum taylorii TaxID=2483200 RepID=A0AAD7XGN6_9STRA|nr:hypothetical protein CTAYLR_001703 [Chrysophaeum taylorii]
MADIISDTVRYWRLLWSFRRGYEAVQEEEEVRVKVHVFSLVLAIKLWDKPHYRKSSYAADVRDNFRNVAIPGTGIPLSVLATHKAVAVGFLVFFYPAICLCAAVAHARRNRTSLSSAYRTQLLAPRDWFSLWRINSRLSAWHSLVTRAPDYEMENKWSFLEKGLKVGVPVSPILKLEKLCIKHKNEEGGMGIHFFDNALNGGDWIVQEVMENSDFVAGLLPRDAPLSTFRVMTASHLDRVDKTSVCDVEAISCVFRAGRSGAKTDHSSVLFDVDTKTGVVGRGTANANWYKLGQINVPWGPPDFAEHPDTGRTITGTKIPNFHENVLRIATDAHAKMLPRVPLAGWDVVLSKNHGPCLLEVNLSCNFFRASFDEPKYFAFVDTYFKFCSSKAGGGE